MHKPLPTNINDDTHKIDKTKYLFMSQVGCSPGINVPIVIRRLQVLSCKGVSEFSRSHGGIMFAFSSKNMCRNRTYEPTDKDALNDRLRERANHDVY